MDTHAFFPSTERASYSRPLVLPRTYQRHIAYFHAKMSSIDDIPDDVLAKILKIAVGNSKTDTWNTECFRCSRVSKRFRSVVFSLCDEIHARVDTRGLFKRMSFGRWLRALRHEACDVTKLVDLDFSIPITDMLPPEMTSVSHMTIRCLDEVVGSLDMKSVFDCFSRDRSCLEHLHIEASGIDTRNIVWSQFEFLRVLRMKCTDMPSALCGIGTLPRLKTLQLSDHIYGIYGTVAECHEICSLTTLEILDVTSSCVPSDLTMLPSLHTLKILCNVVPCRIPRLLPSVEKLALIVTRLPENFTDVCAKHVSLRCRVSTVSLPHGTYLNHLESLSMHVMGGTPHVIFSNLRHASSLRQVTMQVDVVRSFVETFPFDSIPLEKICLRDDTSQMSLNQIAFAGSLLPQAIPKEFVALDDARLWDFVVFI